jgi:hypothetical protein
VSNLRAHDVKKYVRWLKIDSEWIPFYIVAAQSNIRESANLRGIHILALKK